MSCQSSNCRCQTAGQSVSLTATHKQTQVAAAKPFSWQFLHPKYWGIWLTFVLILPLIYLPLSVQFWLGRQIGKLVFLLAKKRVQDTLTNLKLAFADMSEQQRVMTARQVFINQGIGIFESLCAWFRPNVFVRSFSISGLHHLIDAQKSGKAVILLGGHYTTLELGGRLCTQFFAADCVYRPQNNPLLEWFIYNARRRIFDEQIASRDMKKLITRIKQARVIWYSPDQDFGLEHGVMATFFGVPAATITAQRRLAKMGDKANPPALIMMHMVRQTPDYVPRGRRPHYHISLSRALDNYPSNDELADAERINRLIEAAILKDISQWMWFHRRFKTQPDGTNYYQKHKID
ncbi:KDO2-lipid IV(A) lauroyltransferase [Moraxella cuniculi DSM 21768]|uniref:KDO2-lipid IV(A) lauroyltransferase n=1 Tax=Moraxella cuniculi DSM 21768 TaxID=1122245 RepID=A0A1N7FTV9_9GAMM|nr:lipid A biosynthesis acyltransferase [Moraxella cuniculi]OOS05498.1 lipid A biosynthesis acyltransferase [Moraxella cuniculi]SIS03778.1 KDO2-lipid IV(A) lauroyltransferase [Moraxella cuniculi DSM 21768]